jgi:hypothetical protein
MTGKGGRRVNTMQKLCAHMNKCKNDSCCNNSWNHLSGGMKESSGEGEFKEDIFDAR